jgi:multiple sugar transport system permease protein
MDFLYSIGRFFNKPERAAWVFLFPSLLALTLFLFIPLIFAFGISFFDVNVFLKNFQFVEMKNFEELLRDQRFWNSFVNTVYFTILVVPVGTAVSLAIALYVQKNTLFRKTLRSVFYVPVICSMTAISIVWAILLDPTIGMFAYWARMIGFENAQFLKDPDMAMPLVALMSIWKTFGLNMIVLMAALQAVPEDYYEAARIDGASKMRQFFSLTIPSILPTLGFCTVTNTISSFMVFDQTYVMTRGGPLFRTETLAQYVYMRGFAISPFRLGYASAVAEMLFLFVAVISILMYGFFMKSERRVL